MTTNNLEPSVSLGVIDIAKMTDRQPHLICYSSAMYAALSEY